MHQQLSAVQMMSGRQQLRRTSSGSKSGGGGGSGSFKVVGTTSALEETIDINAEALERLVLETLSFYIEHENQDDDEVYQSLQVRVRGLANHTRRQDHKLCNFSQQKQCQYCCHSRLNEIALSLETIIQTTPTLPAHLTADVHSKIGLLRQKQGNATGATQSFLKALWILSSLEDGEEELAKEIAMTKHRLGLAFARSGNFLDSVRLLQNAVEDYQKVPGHGHRKLLEQAEVALQNTMEAQTLQAMLAARQAHSEDISAPGGTARRRATVSEVMVPPPPGSACRRATVTISPNPFEHWKTKNSSNSATKDKSSSFAGTLFSYTPKRQRASFSFRG